MNDYIETLNQQLDSILKDHQKDIVMHLVESDYTIDDIHMMKRLIRQRRSQWDLTKKDKEILMHNIARFDLAQNIKMTQRKGGVLNAKSRF